MGRAAITRLVANALDLPAEGQAFVTQVADGMISHLGCVNTDKSFKPFAVVLNTMLDLVGKEKRMSPAACIRTPFKEASWQKAQAASHDAYVLFKAAPEPAVFKPCLLKLLKDSKLILDMSLGKHGEQRTPVLELREAIRRLATTAKDLSTKGRAFVTQVTDGMISHLGCVNTDKSFKPFAVVLHAMLEL